MYFPLPFAMYSGSSYVISSDMCVDNTVTVYLLCVGGGHYGRVQYYTELSRYHILSLPCWSNASEDC